MWRDLEGALAARKLLLPIDKLFSLDQAVEAQSRMKANEHFGKILLVP